MKSIKIALLATAATFAMGGAALADDGLALSYNVGIASDYVFRGVSQTDENPQLFGGVDASFGKGYAGVWASNVDFNDSTNAEVDVYAGFKPTLGPVALDLGVIYYGYVDAPSGSHYGYWEGKIAASVPAGPATVGGAIYYSPEFFGKTGEATYVEVNTSIPVAEKTTVTAALGHQALVGSGDYNTWNVGVGYALTDHVGLDLRYHDTDEHGFGDIWKSRVVLSLKAAF